MSRKLHISIPEPCSMRWNEMDYIDDSKRHCGSCNKVITDFTRMSDGELIAYFKDHPVACGKFSPQQLNRKINPGKKTRNTWLRAALIPAFLSVAELNAQDSDETVYTEQHADSSRRDIRLPMDTKPAATDSVLVTGTVLEATDSSSSYPLGGALVMLEYGNKIRRGCATDASGNFSILLDSVSAGDTVTVVVSYIGFDRHISHIVLAKEVQPDPVIIRMEQRDGSYTLGILIEETPKSRVKRFFWRLVHPRYWFRRH